MDADREKMDFNGPYGLISGARKDGARYEQFGRYFDMSGRLIGGQEPLPEAATIEVNGSYIPIDSAHWTHIRKAVQDAGGTYTTLGEGRAYLKSLI